MKESIVFLLPPPPRSPIGGYKIVYEYANRLAEKNYKITICHIISLKSQSKVRNYITYYWNYYKRRENFNAFISWFKFHPSVKLDRIAYLTPDDIPQADIIIATAQNTAKIAFAKTCTSSTKGYYLIQGFENWDISTKSLLRTWKLPLKKIFISEWLGNIAKRMGLNYSIIPNGFDFNEFSIDIPITERNPYHISILWHDQALKASPVALNAIIKIKEKFPNTQLEVFGVPPRPEPLPDWAVYHQSPTRATLREIYNRSSIFISPSLSEGWGLSPSEAMICGACVIASNIGGHQSFCKNHHNSILTAPGSSDEITNAMTLLFQNNDLRLRLAYQGNQDMQKYTWDNSLKLFEELLATSLH